MPPLLTTLLAALALALVPAAAAASEVSTYEYQSVYDPKAGSTWVAEATWRADPGELNRLELRREDKHTIVLRDAGAPIRAGRGCAARADGSVACSASFELVGVSLTSGDGDDLLRVDGIQTSADGGAGDDTLIAVGDERARFRGGDGDDTLTGGDGPDLLDGGAGADTISGGDGGDEIVDDPPTGPYSADRIDAGPGGGSDWGLDRIAYDRSTPVVVDLLAGTGGAPGEGDTLAGVEGVSGGSAGDELRGSDGPDALYGGSGGVDLIDGRGGDDALGAADPRSQVIGGDGDDTLRGNGLLACGAGRDNVYEPRLSTVIETASCERIVEPGSFSARALPQRGRTLTLRLRGIFYVESDRCGAVVTVHPAAGGRVLARRFVRLPEGRLRSLRLVASHRPPARLRVEARAAFCVGERVQLKPDGGWDRYDGPTPPLRFSVAHPLRVVVPFG